MTDTDKALTVALVFLGGLILGGVLIALVSLIPAAIAFFAWNALVPGAFHGPHLSFLQCFAAVFLLGVISAPFRRTESKGDAS